MKLYFPEDPKHVVKEVKDRPPPVFSRVMEFKTTGVVMNVFLLDPSARLLAAFVWVSSSNTIGLYALLDWDKPEYVFIDTGIECVRLTSPSSSQLLISEPVPENVLKLVVYPI